MDRHELAFTPPPPPPVALEPRRDDADGGPGPLRCVDAAGIRYRVYDATFGPPHNRPFKSTRYAPPGPVVCVSRYFVPAPEPDGTRSRFYRVYTFRPDEDRAPTADALARQLAGAGYATRERMPAHDDSWRDEQRAAALRRQAAG